MNASNAEQDVAVAPSETDTETERLRKLRDQKRRRQAYKVSATAGKTLTEVSHN